MSSLDNKTILLTGGSGLLGTELQKWGKFFAPPHRSMDITAPDSLWPETDIVVHAAAYTSVEGAEVNRNQCFDVNVKGTLNLLNHYSDVPFVFISTEYSHNPVNFYGVTKSLAEQLVMGHGNYLIIRTLFKPKPWPYPYAFRDKFTLGDYVDVIAEKIYKEIEQWDGKSKLIYVGTGRKSYYDLALETNLDVKPNSINDVKGVKIPRDYK